VAATDSNLNVGTVACSITIGGGPVQITLRGVNRRKSCAEPTKVTDVPSAPSVPRAV
jgi:hypothetical protein